MNLKIILKILCAFLWFWCGVTACVIYMKKEDMKKEESWGSYTIYGIIKARGSDFILQGLYDGMVECQSPKSIEDQIMDSLQKHAGDGAKQFTCGFAVTRKCYDGQTCLTIFNNDFTNIASFFI